MSTHNGVVKESLVVCQSSQGQEIRASLLRLTRYLAVFELHNSTLVLRTSEVLGEFKITFRERTVYSGRAVVRNLVSTGMLLICEVALEESAWCDVAFTIETLRTGKLREQFGEFLQEWQKFYRVHSEYKVIIADMQGYLSDLRLWLDQVEVGIRCSPSEDRLRLEQEVVDELARPILPCIDVLFEKFEIVAKTLEEEWLPAHRHYMRRQLHPLVLCSPFAYRTFHKPLGYAGDYEMVNMIVRNQHEGSSLFAKVVNTWFLRQPPAEAHRNRITYLTEQLQSETLRCQRLSRAARMLSMACGPSQEVQRFLSETPLSDQARFTLLDFNQETLQYARVAIDTLKTQHARQTPIEYVRKSVQQILKESSRNSQAMDKQFDFVYCAGLFDYLSDPVCQRLMNLMYEWVAPGGLLVATNVENANPLRHGMEHLLDWHLIYRTAPDMRRLIPAPALPEEARVLSDITGVNLFLEVRKPADV